jgi:hypothetical protein
VIFRKRKKSIIEEYVSLAIYHQKCKYAKSGNYFNLMELKESISKVKVQEAIVVT